MVFEKKMINEIMDDRDDNEDVDEDDDTDGCRIIPVALDLSAGGLKIIIKNKITSLHPFLKTCVTRTMRLFGGLTLQYYFVNDNIAHLNINFLNI